MNEQTEEIIDYFRGSKALSSAVKLVIDDNAVISVSKLEPELFDIYNHHYDLDMPTAGVEAVAPDDNRIDWAYLTRKLAEGWLEERKGPTTVPRISRD